MLVLSRKVDEFVRVFQADGSFTDVTVNRMTSDRGVRSGFSSPTDVHILRAELLEPDGYPANWAGPKLPDAAMNRHY